MKLLGIAYLCGKSYRRLSGGQQQKVLLARALCATGKMLLLDEPIAGLDPNSMAEMYDMIDKLNKQGIAIITISHDVVNAVGYANKVLHMGQKCFFGNKNEYLSAVSNKNFLLNHSNDRVEK